MSSDDEFRRSYQAARNHVEKVQVCIRERRYKIWQRADKPNLSGDEFLAPILSLPVTHPCVCRARRSAGAGAKFVIEFKYSVAIYGAVKMLYFKEYFADDWTLKLEIQSLRDDEES